MHQPQGSFPGLWWREGVHDILICQEATTSWQALHQEMWSRAEVGHGTAKGEQTKGGPEALGCRIWDSVSPSESRVGLHHLSASLFGRQGMEEKVSRGLGRAACGPYNPKLNCTGFQISNLVRNTCSDACKMKVEKTPWLVVHAD